MADLPHLTQKIKGPYFLDIKLTANRTDQDLIRTQEDRTLGPSIKIDTLSPDFDKSEISFKPGLALRKSTKKSTLYLGLDYNLGTYATSLWDDGPVEKSYRFFQPVFGLDHEYKSGRRISFKYTSRSNTPSANQLLPVVNNFNSLSVFYGNRRPGT